MRKRIWNMPTMFNDGLEFVGNLRNAIKASAAAGIVLVLLSMTVLAPSVQGQQNCTVTGPWQGTFVNSKGNGGTISASLSQTGTSFSGTVTVTDKNGTQTSNVTGSNSNGSVSFGPVQYGQSTLYADGQFSNSCGTLSGNFHQDKPSGTIVGNYTATTPQVTISSIDLVNNLLSVTLSDPSNTYSGTLDLIAHGLQNGDQTISVDDGATLQPKQYQVPFDRVSLKVGQYDQVIAQWNVAGGIQSATFSLTPQWLVRGIVQNTSYIFVHEDACTKPASGPYWAFDSKTCAFSQIQAGLKTDFASQTWINGSGITIGNVNIHANPTSLCKAKFPQGATKQNTFYTISVVKGSCGSIMTGGTDVAVFPNPKKKADPLALHCNDSVVMVDPNTDDNVFYPKTAEDYCPACRTHPPGTDDHIDNYFDVDQCFAASLPDLWTADASGDKMKVLAALNEDNKTKVRADMFEPERQREIVQSYQDLTLRLQTVNNMLAISVSTESQQSFVTLPEEILQVNELRRFERRAVVVGMASGTVFVVAVIDLDRKSVVDHFYCFNPAVSPDGRFVAYLKFYPPHFVKGVDDHYMLYDVSSSASENRTAGVSLSDDTNVGLAVYPPGIGNTDGDNIGVPESTVHSAAGYLFWSPDSQRLVFAEQDKTLKLVMIKVSADGKLAPAGVMDLNHTRVCSAPLLLDGRCEGYLNRIEFEITSVKAQFSGIGTKASVHRDLVVPDADFVTSVQ